MTLPPSVVRALSVHKARQNEARLKAGDAWFAHDLVFCTQTGEPLDHRVLARRYFKPLLKAAGLPATIRPYDLRHSAASLLLGAGESVRLVSETLGHSSAAMTLDVYAHVLPGMQERAAERMEALLFPSATAATR